MSTTTAPRRRVAPPRVRALCQLMVVAGVVGAASAVVIIAWPDQVSDQHYSYPFGVAWYVAAQAFFAAQHLGLVAGLVGLTALARSNLSRTTRTGLVFTTAGLVGLTACELFAITAADALVDTGRANTVDSSYGFPMVAIGLGLLVAGIGFARRPVLPGAGRWLVLAMGGYVFVVMFPAVFGPTVAGRLAIGVWMLMFAVLGSALIRAEQQGARS